MKISIVISAYNVENYIRQCLNSVLGQTYDNIEVIVINDCSTDKTSEVIGAFNDSRLVVVNHDKNMGPGWARRHGIEASTGEYVITVDADDRLSANFIRQLARNADETDADIVSGGITLTFPDGYERIERFPVKLSKGFEKFKDYANQRIIFLNNKLVRRSMYETVPYCTRRYCEDTPVILPLLYYANMVSYVDTQGYFYRQHDNSLCHSVSAFEQALFKALCSKDCMEFFSDKGKEYEGLISTQEFVGYIHTLKASITAEHEEKYRNELGELFPAILKMISL